MSDPIRSFVIEGEKISVPAVQGDKLLEKFPDAKEFVSFQLDKDTVDIPKGQADMFMMKFKDASPLPGYDFKATTVGENNVDSVPAEVVSDTTQVQPTEEVANPTVSQAPKYEIDGKEFVNKDEYIKEVEKYKGKPNTPKFSVSNDEETNNRVKGLLLEDEFYNKKVEEGDAAFGVSTYAMEKHSRDNYGKVSEKVKAVDEKVVGEYTAKFEADQKAISLTANKEEQSLKATETALTEKAKEIKSNLPKSIKALDNKDPKSEAEAKRLTAEANKQLKAVGDEYDSAIENYKTKVNDLNVKAQTLATKYDNEANVSLTKEHKQLADSVDQSEYFDKDDETAIQKALENAPVGYAEKKAYIQDLVDTYSAGFDAEDLPQVKKDLFAMVSPKVLFDEKGDPTVYTFKNQADTQMQRLIQKKSELSKQVESMMIKEGSELYRPGVSAADYANDLWRAKQSDPMLFTKPLSEAIDKLDKTRIAIGEYEKVLSSPEGTKTIKAGGFWENFTKETAVNVATAGFYGAAIANRIGELAKRGEKISPEDKEILNAAMLKNAVEGRMQDNYSMAKIVGQGLAASLPFITSMVTSGGAAGVASAAAKKALKWQLMKTTLKTGAGASNFAKGAASVMAGAAVRVPMSGMFYEGLEKRVVDVQSKFVGNKFEAEAKQSENSLAYDVMKQFIATYPDFLTEGMEPAIAKYLTAPVAKKLGLAWLTDKGKGQLNKWVGRAANATNMHDLPTEILSEELAGVMGIATGEQKADEFFNRKSQMALILTVAAMSTPMSVVKSLTSQPDVTGMESILNPTQLTELNKIVSLQNLNDKAEKLTKFSFDNNLSDDQVMEVATYAWDNQQEQVQQIAEAAPVVENKPAEVINEDITPVVDIRPNEDILAEHAKTNSEIDVDIAEAQTRLGLPVVPSLSFTDDTEITLDKLDNEEPVTNEFIKKASDELYKQYKTLEAMKTAENRQYTTEQIESMQEFLGEEITKLEEHANKQTEKGEFIGKDEVGVTPESGKGTDIAEAPTEKVAEIATVPDSKPIAPIREEVAKKPIPEPLETDIPTTAEGITKTFSDMGEGMKKASLLQVIDQLGKGDVIFKNAEAIKAAKENENYKTEVLPDGSLKIVDVKNPDTGEWVGKEKVSEISISPSIIQAVNESETAEEAFKKVSAIKDITPEESRAFREKYDPKGVLSPLQAFTNYFNEVKQLKTKQNDQQNISGLSGEIGAGKEPQQAQPIERTGTEKVGTGGNVQAHEKVIPLGKGEMEATDKELNAISPKGVKDVYTAGRKIFGLNKVQALAQAIIVDRIVAKMAKNKSISKLKAYEGIEFRKVDKAMADKVTDKQVQANKGAMMMVDGKAIVMALTDPNLSTPLHEIAHVYERYMTEAERKSVLAWTGDKTWNVQTSEKFARGFERYLAEGISPNKALEAVFKRLKEWMVEIYNGIKGSAIDLTLSPNMQNLYSSILTGKKYVPLEVKIEGAIEGATVEVGKPKTTAEALDNILDGLSFQNSSPLFQAIGEKGAIGVEGLIADLTEAKQKTEEGVDAKTIFIATGWELFPDGWRYDLPDVQLTDEFKNFDKINTPFWLKDAIDDKTGLLKAYPELREVIVVFDNSTAHRGSWNKESGIIYLSKKLLSQYTDNPTESVRSTLLHEVQHVIQSLEGFARGGNMESGLQALQDKIRGTLSSNPEFKRLEQEATPPKGWFKGWSVTSDTKVAQAKKEMNKMLLTEAQKLLKAGSIDELKYEAYRRIAGEVEARNVQKRLTFSPEKRKETMLSESQDVVEEQKIYIQKAIKGEALSVEKPLFQANEDQITKVLNQLVDESEARVEKDVPKAVKDAIARANEKRKANGQSPLPFTEAQIEKVLSDRGYKKAEKAVDKDLKGMVDTAMNERMQAAVQQGIRTQAEYDKFIQNGFGSYIPISQTESQDMADVMFDALGTSPDDRIDNAMKLVIKEKMNPDVAIALLVRASVEVETQQAKASNEATIEYYINKSVEILGVAESEGTNYGRGISYFNSQAVKKHWGWRTYLRDYEKSIKDNVNTFFGKNIEGKVVEGKFIPELDKNGNWILKGDLKKLSDALDIKKMVKEARPVVTTSPKYTEVRDKVTKPEPKAKVEKEKVKSLFSEWKSLVDTKKSGILFQGEERTEKQILSEIIGAYIRMGVYKTKDIIDKVKAEVKANIGLNISDEAIIGAIPTEVGGKPFDEWQEEEEEKKASEVLAQRLKALASEKKPDNDPLHIMIRTLVSKASEKMSQGEKKGKTDLEIIAISIQNRDAWMDVWNEAKGIAFDKIDKSKVDDSVKDSMKAKIEDAYRLATKAPFSEALLDRTIKETAEELGIRIDRIVHASISERVLVKSELQQALIDKAGLSGTDAQALADAVAEAFDNFITVKSAKEVDKYITKQDKLKPIPLGKIVQLLKEETAKFKRKFPNDKNPFDYMRTEIRRMAKEKLQSDPTTQALYTDAKIDKMTDLNLAAAAFISATEVQDLANMLSADMREKIANEEFLKDFPSEEKAKIVFMATSLQSESMSRTVQDEDVIIRSRAVSEMIGMVRAGAFENENFLRAFAIAKGIAPPTPAQVAEVKRLHDVMKKEKSEIIKKERELELTAYIANFTKPDIASIVQVQIVTGMLAGIGTMTYNATVGFLASQAMRAIQGASSLYHLDFNRLALVHNAWGKTSFRENWIRAKGVFQSGFAHETSVLDVPTMIERARTDSKILNFMIAHSKYVIRAMMTPDNFNVGMLEEGLIQLRMYDEAHKDWRNTGAQSKKDWIKNYLYADIGITPDSKRDIKRELDNIIDEAAKEIDPITGDPAPRYYSKRQQTLLLRELVDKHRAEVNKNIRTWQHEAHRNATWFTGNAEFMGTIGNAAKMLTDITKTFVKGHTKGVGIAMMPVTFFTLFLRIFTVVAEVSLNANPFIGIARYKMGRYGLFLGEGNKQRVNLTEYDKEIIRKQVKFGLGVMAATATILLSGIGGDDEDPWFSVTGGGGGILLPDPIAAAQRTKTHSYQSFSLKFGNMYVPYIAIPGVSAALIPLGNLMDVWRYGTTKATTVEEDENGNKRAVTKEVLNRIRYADQKLEWFAKGLIPATLAVPIFVSTQSVLPVAQDFSDALVGASVKALTKAQSMVQGITVDDGDVPDGSWDMNTLMKDVIVKAVKYSNIKNAVAPAYIRDIYGSWAFLTNQAMEDGDPLEKILVQNTILQWAFMKGGTPQINVWGQELIVHDTPLNKRLFSFKGSDPIIAYHNTWDKAPSFASMRTEFYIPGEDKYISRPLDMSKHDEWKAFYEFTKERGNLIYDAASRNMNKVDQEYRDAMAKAVEEATKRAKKTIQDRIDTDPTLEIKPKE